jgi:Asp/Glu/hydantoin racemase
VVRDATGWRLDLLAAAPDLDDCLWAVGRLVGMRERPVVVRRELSTVTVVTAVPTHPRSIDGAVQDALAASGVRPLYRTVHPHRTAFLVADADGPELLRAIHDRIADRVPLHLGAA